MPTGRCKRRRLAVLLVDFDCGRARRGGRVSSVPVTVSIVSIAVGYRVLSGRKRLRFPCIQGGRRHRGGSLGLTCGALFLAAGK
jgi:hypothetical protein